MNTRILLIATVTCSLATPLLADEAARPTTTAPAAVRTEPDVLRIIQLKHADSQYVASALSGLFQGFNLRALDRSNAILFLGSDKAFARVAELITQIDVPQEGSGQEGVEVRMLPVRNRRAE